MKLMTTGAMGLVQPGPLLLLCLASAVPTGGALARAAGALGCLIGAPLQEKRYRKLLRIEGLAKVGKSDRQESQLVDQFTEPSLSVALGDFERAWCGSRHGYLTP
jgi:hypothetical protein